MYQIGNAWYFWHKDYNSWFGPLRSKEDAELAEKEVEQSGIWGYVPKRPKEYFIGLRD